MEQTTQIQLNQAYEQWAKEPILSTTSLPRSGSDREYIRFISATKSALGVYNPDEKENNAFLSFTAHFLSVGISVPRIYFQAPAQKIYLLEDLGDTTLYAYLNQKRQGDGFPEEVLLMYKKIIKELPKIQVMGGRGLDYSVCYPREKFDHQSMRWDVNYFKYYFLKLAGILFDEQQIEDDFDTFIAYLLQAENSFFLYRDFQSRNIMIVNNEPYFIDYQGGRQGALPYDIASLLYDAKANIPEDIRQELFTYYLEQLETYTPIDKESFTSFYQGFVLIRIMQAMGAYGFRGFYEKKEHFLLSIPFALNNLKQLLSQWQLPIQLPTLFPILSQLVDNNYLRTIGEKKQTLTVSITSFSYKKGLPIDETGNGGGFVFDCRAIHNPGKYDPYKLLTGRDEPVKEFLKKERDMDLFLLHIFSLVEQSVDRYIERGFAHLMVNFGCTGGQHRSVYSAEKLAYHLKNNYDISIQLIHREQNIQLTL